MTTFFGILLMSQVMKERAEFASIFRGKGSVQKDQKPTFIELCSNTIGAHPDLIMQKKEIWEMLPDHLKDYVRNATRRHRASELQPVLLEEMFIEEDMAKLDLDDFPGVNNTFLRTVHTRIDLEQLTFLSLVGNTAIHGKTVASFLQGCVNMSHINLKSCINLKNDTFPERLVKQLPQLSYLNISFTMIGGKAVALIYSYCPKLATLKMAGCNLIEGLSISKIFRHPSENLISLKIRHCTINQAQLQHILDNLPNLQTFDCSSSPASVFRNLFRPFLNISHPSQLRKLNLSNLPNLDFTRPADLKAFFTKHANLEHIYLTDANVDAKLIIPASSLAKFKTLFVPGISYATTFLPVILEIAHNLTYLDLSRTRLRFDKNDYHEPLVFNVPHLRTLSLEDTSVGDYSADLISQIHTLRSLFLRNTAISPIGVRVIIYACPWLDEVDLSSCRSIAVYDRRTLGNTLRQEFWEKLAQAREKGKVLEQESGEWYTIERFYSEGEERDGLVRVLPSDEQ